MSWLFWAAAYLLAGAVDTWIADRAIRRRGIRPMDASEWILGALTWPAIEAVLLKRAMRRRRIRRGR